MVEKNKDHRSNLYDDAWMPHMLRITWNGIALHGGPLPGYPASHGCVRMPFGFAEKLFDRIRMNTRIIISPNDAEPVEFSHPALFVPNAEALAAAPARAEKLAREADEAAKMAKQAKNEGRQRSARRRRSRRRCASWNRRTTPGPGSQLEKARRSQDGLATAKTETSAEGAAGRGGAADTPRPTRSKLDAALRRPPSGETRRVEAAKAARDAKLALVPVSVFISRATQKLYVRRNTQERLPDAGELFDAIEVPITIRNPGQPIGTHVITAVASADGGLRWTAVTDRRRGRRQGRARPHHHPAGGDRSLRADGIAAIFDHHLG